MKVPPNVLTALESLRDDADDPMSNANFDTVHAELESGAMAKAELRTLRLAIAFCTKAIESGDRKSLATVNEELQGLVDAFISRTGVPSQKRSSS
jgi:hypothetical protein